MVTTPANSINESGASGLCNFNGTATFGTTALTQYYVVSGASSNTVNNIAPSTSGYVLTSNGASSQPTFQAPGSSSIITLTGDSGGGLTGSSFTITGGTTGLTFAGAGTTLTLGGTLAIADGGTDATSFGTTHGIVVYNGTSLVNYAGPQISTSGYATNSAQPCFSAYLNTGVTNKTGDGTRYTVLFDTVSFDNTTSYATGTGLFTVPVTGHYIFMTSLVISGLTSSHTTGQIFINYPMDNVYQNFYNMSSGGLLNIQTVTPILYLTATTTIGVALTVSGGTKAVSLTGSISCNFSGFMLFA